MARRPRPNLAGGLCLVIQRGSYRQRLFQSNRDRNRFLETLGKHSEALSYRVHAYCLMGNHVHLLLETKRANLSKVLQRLMGSYTLYYHRKRENVGDLFQGRSKAYLVDSREYLLEVSRYIHLNPVEAGLIREPERYPWSSLAGYRPGGKGPAWLTTGRILGRFGGDRERYLRFVYQGMGKEWKPDPVKQVFLGGKAFVERMMSKLGWEEDGRRRRPPGEAWIGKAPDRILRRVARGYGLRVRELLEPRRKDPKRAQARQAACYALRRATPLTLASIGRLLGGISPSAVAHAEEGVTRSPLRLRKARRLLAKS